jgi:hypothetical protein
MNMKVAIFLGEASYKISQWKKIDLKRTRPLAKLNKKKSYCVDNYLALVGM